ncbi:tissue factor [Malaclemys terrapin pileata]|uniref:tissue factor n=1 Tax=Malaclemys terrapin pileata TaxID=2991368 RepID=UPI0023A7C852|nr:tissue factor [Malaclemys terrapin pileata]
MASALNALVAACGRALLLAALLSQLDPCSGNSEPSTAVNITWSSINFKTILQWQPVPTNYVYTVKISGINSNWEKVCVHTKETECDVTDKLEKVKDTYTAHIVSEMLSGTEKFEEPPYAISPKFTPYNQTKIGTPGIQTYELTDSKLKVLVEDPLTPYRFPNKSFKSIREIFKNDLEYTLYYWKDQSTGKKEATTKSNQFEISIDKGENYCFFVQATILSRRENRKSQESKVKCTSDQINGLAAYGTEVFIIIAAVAIVILIAIIGLSVTLYKCKKTRAAKEKETMPLTDV